jgi:hypothetical protein
MLEQVEDNVGQFAADGACDARPMYEALAASGAADIRIVIPPKKTATVDSRATRPWGQRNEAIGHVMNTGYEVLLGCSRRPRTNARRYGR